MIILQLSGLIFGSFIAPAGATPEALLVLPCLSPAAGDWAGLTDTQTWEKEAAICIN